MSSVEGWLFKVVTPGNEPDTRPITEWWAVWGLDEIAATAALVEKIGPDEPTPSAERTLSEEELKDMGLTKAGEIRKVDAKF
jgi:hypothetical protein